MGLCFKNRPTVKKKKKKKTQQVLPVGLYDLLNKHNTIKNHYD